MRSIPLALTWELLHRGRWTLPAAALGANVMPLLLLTALRSEGGVDPGDPSMLIIHIVLAQISMLCFASALYAAQGPPSRLFALPVTNATLVAWHLVPSMVLMVLHSLASTAVLNALFDLDWPLWGPAFVGAVGYAAVAAALWLTERTGWILVGLTFVATVLGLWLKSRYGGAFSQPSHQWREVTPLDAVTLLAMGAIAWSVAVLGVARSRRSDPLPAFGIVAWIQRLLDPAPRLGRPFRSPAEAQLWFEWRKKGWAMPIIVAFSMLIGLAGWLVFSRNGTELLTAFYIAGVLMSVWALVIALIMGNCGRDDGHYEIASFLSTRPIATTDLAHIIVKTAGQSLLVSWILWAAVFLVAYLLLVPTRLAALPTDMQLLPWWYWPATLIAPWAIIAAGMSAGLTGRANLWAALLLLVISLWIGTLLFTRYWLPQQDRDWFLHGCTAAVGVLLVVLTAWVFIAARRREFISWPTVGTASTLWAALAVVAIGGWLLKPAEPFAVTVFMVGVLALAISPLACAPLALAWNRNR